jgi:hypothetical protein
MYQIEHHKKISNVYTYSFHEYTSPLNATKLPIPSKIIFELETKNIHQHNEI